MAGLMVTASTGVMKPLLGKLATFMGEEFAKLKNLRKEVKFISDELTAMKDALESISYLDDLDPQTKGWRDLVREMSYDIEDTIDDFMQKIGERNDGIISNTVDRLKTLRVRHNIAGQIEDIKNLVTEASARRQRYKLDIPLHNSDTPLSSNVVIDPRVSALYEDAANLVGVEAPTHELVNFLADEDKQLKIVSIVGFGGLGKTTLANVVYGRLKEKFNQSAFVPVSQKPDILKLLLGLLSQLKCTTSPHDCELNVLLDKLREHLQNRRYLIVIDDIWDVKAWSLIKCAFPENNLGSRVIVTTRIHDVAKACCLHGNDHILEMKPLNSKDSRRLFLGRIFGSEEACPIELRDTSVEILKRCGGLPLAIISISSMLASENPNQKERWEHVRDSLGSVTNLTLERMREILNLSYKDLPSHLRTCFLYLGMYPEDYKIDRSNLERQWMAEGFISKQNEQDVAKVARSYFNELVNRSLIQAVDFDNQGSVMSCTVHDMMLDLILIKSAEENFFTIVDDPQAITGLDYKIRRLSIRRKDSDVVWFTANISMSQVRTIMMFGCPPGDFYSEFKFEFKFLRVFFSEKVREPYFVHLTGQCKMYHLRYLHITENIRWTDSLQPRVLRRLLNSCFLSGLLAGGIGNMESLQDLSGFDFAENKLDNIQRLGELANLRYLVLVCRLAPDDKKKRLDALCSSLGRLSSLEELLVDGLRMGNIDGLFPSSPPSSPYRLQILRMLRGGHFSRVPSWVAELRCLRELQCTVDDMRDDGVGILADLPVLSVLDIGISWGPCEGIVFSGKAFPTLKLLKFSLLRQTASYLTFQPGAMPKLQRLELEPRGIIWEQNDVAPAGLEHLLALKEISVSMIHAQDQSDKANIQSGWTSAMNMHPGNPRPECRIIYY